MQKRTLQRTRWAGIGLLALLVGFFAACEDLDELNTPPDQLDAADLDESLLGQQFAQSQFHGMRGSAGGGGLQIGKNLFGDLFAQYFATTAENFDSDQYIQVGGWANSAWNYIYGTPGPQIAALVEFTEENDLPVQNAVAKIWRVNVFHTVTDQWGPIIYSEYNSGETSVPYDSQEDVYNMFFDELEEAIGVLQDNPDGFAYGNDDLVYSGDIESWIRFANSLRLRLAMRVVYADEELAQYNAEEAADPANGGLLESNDDNAFVLTTEDSENPMNIITNWGEFRMSATMHSVLHGYEDPRVSVYFNEPTGDLFDDYHGMRQGLPPAQKSSDLNAQYSDIDERWRPGGTPPIEVMRSAEVWLNLAEASWRNWNVGVDAQDAYETAIRLSMEERPAAEGSEIDDYISSTNTPIAYTNSDRPEWDLNDPVSDVPVAWSNDPDEQYEQIAIQRWLALYPDGIQAWAELRRTGVPFYPIVESRNSNLNEDEIFRRMNFVSNEYDNNSSATNAAVDMLDGPDNNATRVWWDQKEQ